MMLSLHECSLEFYSQFSRSVHPMDCRTPGFPVHHQLLEPTHTHAHHVGDAIQLEFCRPSINHRRNHSFISHVWFPYFVFFKAKLNLYFSDYNSSMCSTQQIKKIKEHISKECLAAQRW